MRIDYIVSEDGLRIDTFPKGILDIKGTIDHFYRIKNDGGIKQGAVEIVYFKYVYNLKILHTEKHQIKKSYQDAESRKKIKARIFVCENGITYTIGMMLQTLHGLMHPDYNLLVVSSEDEFPDAMNHISPNNGYQRIRTLNTHYWQVKHE